MYDAVLRDPAFFRFLLRIDQELAAETRRGGCPHCAGALHVSDFPRKPRGCPAAVIEEYSSRFSFTCGRCEQRATAASVRFLGRRVYVAAVLMLDGGQRILCAHGSGKPHAVALSHRLRSPRYPIACWFGSSPSARRISWRKHCAFSHH